VARGREGKESMGVYAVASRGGGTDVMMVLVEQWPESMRERGRGSLTSWHLVAGAGKKEVVEFLVEQWAQGMMEMDNCLNTSLHLAAKAGKTDVVEFCGAVSRGREGKKTNGVKRRCIGRLRRGGRCGAAVGGKLAGGQGGARPCREDTAVAA
jgi:hypothetical protein